MEVTNPLVESERFLRSSMMPGLVRAVRFNTERRQGDLRLFEVGTVFDLAEDSPAGPEAGPEAGPPTKTSERLSAVFALQDDDAWTAVAAWHTIAGALRIADWTLDDRSLSGTPAQVLHFYRSAAIIGPDADGNVGTGPVDHPTALGVVGELNPYLVGQFGLLDPDGRPRQLGWLDLDIGVLLDRHRVPRRSEEARPISRYPSSDIDLAFVVAEDIQPTGWSEPCARRAGSCSNRSTSSTSTGVLRWRRARAVWRSVSGSAPWIARSPMRRSAPSGADASRRWNNAIRPPCGDAPGLLWPWIRASDARSAFHVVPAVPSDCHTSLVGWAHGVGDGRGVDEGRGGDHRAGRSWAGAGRVRPRLR